MKIDTDLSKNYLACFDEARGIAIHKKKILKTKKSKVLSYMQERLIIFILLCIISLLSSIFCCFECNIMFFSCLIYLIAIIYLIITFCNIISIYSFRKKHNFKNSIVIDKNGITDESYHGIKMMFKWGKILGVVIGKHTVTILTDTPVYFYFNISKKDDVINAIEKYGDKDKIIY